MAGQHIDSLGMMFQEGTTKISDINNDPLLTADTETESSESESSDKENLENSESTKGVSGVTPFQFEKGKHATEQIGHTSAAGSSNQCHSSPSGVVTKSNRLDYFSVPTENQQVLEQEKKEFFKEKLTVGVNNSIAKGTRASDLKAEQSKDAVAQNQENKMATYSALRPSEPKARHKNNEHAEEAETSPPAGDTTDDERWNIMYKELRAYADSKGDCLMPEHYNAANSSLGRWVHEQQTLHSQNLLDKDREGMLQKLGFVWHSQGEVGKKKNCASNDSDAGKNSLLPTITPEMVQAKQATAADNSGQEQAPETTTKPSHKLAQLGFIWEFTSANEDPWNKKYEELKAFVAAHGHCLVPRYYAENLGNWVNTQRRYYHQNRLSNDRKQKLVQLGFIWKPTSANEDGWNKKYEELKAYVVTHGNCLVPAKSQENPSLGTWVGAQRRKHNKNELSKDREEKLRQLGFVWKVNKSSPAVAEEEAAPKSTTGEEHWNQKHAELKAYVAKKGNCLVPSRYQENPSLGKWVGTQRSKHSKNQLSKDREEKLRQLGFVWKVNKSSPAVAEEEAAPKSTTHEEYWNQKYEELKACVATKGDCLVPSRYQENPSLGQWVSQQRVRYKQNTLNKDREQKLEQLGFVWNVKPVPKGDKSGRAGRGRKKRPVENAGDEETMNPRKRQKRLGFFT